MDVQHEGTRPWGDVEAVEVLENRAVSLYISFGMPRSVGTVVNSVYVLVVTVTSSERPNAFDFKHF